MQEVEKYFQAFLYFVLNSPHSKHDDKPYTFLHIDDGNPERYSLRLQESDYDEINGRQFTKQVDIQHISLSDLELNLPI